jgi:hypothetical protein
MDMACLGHPWNRSGNGFGHPVFTEKPIYGIKPSTGIENLDSPMSGRANPPFLLQTAINENFIRFAHGNLDAPQRCPISPNKKTGTDNFLSLTNALMGDPFPTSIL